MTKLSVILLLLAQLLQPALAQEEPCRFITEPIVWGAPHVEVDESFTSRIELLNNITILASAGGLKMPTDAASKTKSVLITLTLQSDAWIPTEAELTRYSATMNTNWTRNKPALRLNEAVVITQAMHDAAVDAEVTGILAVVQLHRWLFKKLEEASEIDLNKCEAGTLLGNLPDVEGIQVLRNADTRRSAGIKLLTSCTHTMPARGTLTFDSRGDVMQIEVERNGAPLDDWGGCNVLTPVGAIFRVTLIRAIRNVRPER